MAHCDTRRPRKATAILRAWLDANVFNQAMLDSEWNAIEDAMKTIVRVVGQIDERASGSNATAASAKRSS